MFTKLYEYRKKYDLTMKECAAIAGIGETSYLRYERGDRVPPADVLLSYCCFYDVSFEELCGLSEVRE